MAWTTPKSWTSTMVTAAQLNEAVKDNLLVLSTHTHTDAAGQGESTLAATVLSAQNYFPMVDQSANPASTGVLQRNGSNLTYYNSKVVSLSANAAAATPSLRSLGTGSTQAAAGNHTH